MRAPKPASAFLVFAGLLLAGCASTTQKGAVGGDRQQLLLVSSAELEKMAAQNYTKLTKEAAGKGTLNKDVEMTKRVRAIAERIKPQTAVFRKDAPDWKWEVNVLQSPELNAFCMPGGKIVFYSGIITKLSLTDDEIGVIMGHEVAHALREHSREQVSQALAAQAALGIGAALLGVSSGYADLAGVAYKSLVATKFSRMDETEADRIGLELAARAGYDPRAGPALWTKMMKLKEGSGGSIEILSTHPADAARIKETESLLPIVMPLYEEAKRR